jgi:hypothetical protein
MCLHTTNEATICATGAEDYYTCLYDSIILIMTDQTHFYLFVSIPLGFWIW